MSNLSRGDMAVYICAACGKKFEIREKVQCPYCGYRIALKPRLAKEKVVMAR